jgi:hypothetical protein
LWAASEPCEPRIIGTFDVSRFFVAPTGLAPDQGTASIPVIALTDRLFDFLNSHGDRRFYSKDIEPVRTLLRPHTYKGPKGKVSFWYLDYISVIAKSIDWITSDEHYKSCVAAPPDRRDHIRELGYRKNLRRWFREHARQIQLAHARGKDESVKRKYEWLAAYHNEIAPKFIESSLALCVLPKP